ncbi:MAG TPA: hypothetical protein VK504_17405, partial [Vicinamibacterales bacterium]|nr:hypothetical protein [Vicinamibacterales bacterium]
MKSQAKKTKAPAVRSKATRSPRPKKSPVKSAPKHEPVALSYVLRTTDRDLRSYNDFQWPASGPVACPDWNPQPVCGGGLHGWLWGAGDWGLKRKDEQAKWLVVEVETSSIVSIDNGQKVKFPKGVVVGTFDHWRDAMTFIRAKLLQEAKPQSVATKEGEIASATGDSGHASATGDSGHASATGYSGHASATGNSGHASATGDSGHASATGNSGHASATGYS